MVSWWTDERIERLRELWPTMNCPQIAQELGAGAMADTVLKKGKRLGLVKEKSVWPSDCEVRLREMWPTNMTCAEMGSQLNMTKNAIIGKARRLGLPSRKPPASMRRPKRKIPRVTVAPRAPGIVFEHKPMPHIEPAVDVVPLHVEFDDLEACHCRFPLGRGPYTFCGHPKMDGSSYCAPHYFHCTGVGTASERAAHRVTPSLVPA